MLNNLRFAAEWEIAYLAGFIDGEGSIVIARGRWIKHRRGHALHLSAKQVDRRPLDLLAERYGGRVIPTPATQPGRQPYFRWGVVSRQAAAALLDLMPYLVVKREQAELALDFQKTMLQRGGQRVPEEVYAERDRLAERISALKRVQA